MHRHRFVKSEECVSSLIWLEECLSSLIWLEECVSSLIWLEECVSSLIWLEECVSSLILLTGWLRSPFLVWERAVWCPKDCHMRAIILALGEVEEHLYVVSTQSMFTACLLRLSAPSIATVHTLELWIKLWVVNRCWSSSVNTCIVNTGCDCKLWTQVYNTNYVRILWIHAVEATCQCWLLCVLYKHCKNSCPVFLLKCWLTE